MGVLFRTTGDLYRTYFLPILGIAVLFTIPSQVFDAEFTRPDHEFMSPAFFSDLFVRVSFDTFFYCMAAALLTPWLYRTQWEPQAGALSCLPIAVARFGPLLLVVLIVSNLAAVGMLFLFLPGFLLITIWLPAEPVCLIEGKGPIASLNRAAELTRGNRMRLFGACVLPMAVYIVLLGMIPDGGDDPSLLLMVVEVLLKALLTGFFIALQTVCYVMLTGTGRAAKVFE